MKMYKLTTLIRDVKFTTFVPKHPFLCFLFEFYAFWWSISVRSVVFSSGTAMLLLDLVFGN